MTKIFGIGLPRTGTSSVHHAAMALGLRSSHHDADPRIRRQLEAGDYRLVAASEVDLLTDQVLPIVFPQIHAAFPGAKFIYTVRDEDSWIESLKKVEFTRLPARIGSYRYYARLAVFGVTVFHEERYRWVFRDHDRRVREYFSGERAKNLLIFDVTRGDGWAELCPFLGVPIPDIPFPHVNVGGAVKRGRPSLRRRIERRLYELTG